jgi:diguanylate cyclase (GGDEF)-like protein
MQHLQSADLPNPGRRFERRPSLEALADGALHDPLAAGGVGLITSDLGRRAGADRTLLALRDSPTGPVEVVSAWDAERGPEDLPRPPLADGFVGRVLDSEHSAVEPIDTGRFHAAGAPVRTPDGTTGALCAAFSAAPAAQTTLWVVESYARFAALCLHDPDVFDGLLDAARRDALTGCLCYGAVHQEVIREIRRSARSGRSLSCCFIDLDRFKAVNDTHGHLHGSRVLASVAAALRHAVRDGDTLGRYGGDEFVALLPDTDEAAAHVLAERLRTAILAVQPTGGEATVDASIGVAQWLPGSSAEEMLGAADDALRSAKALGGGVAVRASELQTDILPGKTPGRTA